MEVISLTKLTIQQAQQYLLVGQRGKTPYVARASKFAARLEEQLLHSGRGRDSDARSKSRSSHELGSATQMNSTNFESSTVGVRAKPFALGCHHDRCDTERTERQRDTERDRERKRETDRGRERQRETERDRERQRETDRERERERERDREQERGEKDRERVRDSGRNEDEQTVMECRLRLRCDTDKGHKNKANPEFKTIHKVNLASSDTSVFLRSSKCSVLQRPYATPQIASHPVEPRPGPRRTPCCESRPGGIALHAVPQARRTPYRDTFGGMLPGSCTA